MSDATSTVATPPEDTSSSTSQNGAKQPDMCNDASQPGSQRSSTDLIPIASSSDTVRRKSDRNRAKLHRNYADIHKRGLTGVAYPNLAYNICLSSYIADDGSPQLHVMPAEVAVFSAQSTLFA